MSGIMISITILFYEVIKIMANLRKLLYHSDLEATLADIGNSTGGGAQAPVEKIIF